MATKKTRPSKEQDESTSSLSQALAPVYERLDIHGEMLRGIIRLLTEEKESDGPPLHQLLSDLITRLDRQSGYLKELTVAVGKLGMTLPLDLVQAIDDNLDIPRRQNGHPQEGLQG